MKKKLVYGVGIMDADYTVQEFIYVLDENGKKKRKRIRVCPFYEKWKSMLARCYYEQEQERHPTYKGCSVCEEWLTFSNFKRWMEKQDWQNRQLDKDILFPGNKVYSPDTCVFVDQRVNKFLTENTASRGEYLIGVCWRKDCNKFQAMCCDGKGRQKHLGYFNTEVEAHKIWLSFKLKVAQELASEQSDARIAEALIDRYGTYNAN